MFKKFSRLKLKPCKPFCAVVEKLSTLSTIELTGKNETKQHAIRGRYVSFLVFDSILTQTGND